MSRNRLKLDNIFRSIAPNVYFQPPESMRMKYPCILYELTSIDTKFADNNPYVRKKRYKVTVIDKNPDSDIPDKIGGLPMTIFDRHYTSDNLHHFVFNIY